MGCFHTKIQNSNPDFSDVDFDLYGYGGAKQPAIDYTTIVTKDITSLRNKLKEISSDTEDKVC
jgi:hypothetical protein